MVRRALMLALFLVALMAAPAAAQQGPPYPDETATLTPAGDVLQVVGEGFIPNAVVNFSVEFTPEGGSPSIVETGQVTANAQGTARFDVEVRGDGVYRVTMTDGTTTLVATATVDAAAAPNRAPVATPLPRTGDDSTLGLAQIGFAAVAIGSVAVYGAKRRQKTFA